MGGLAFHWPLDGALTAAVGGEGADAAATRVAFVEDVWDSSWRTPRLAAHFVGDAAGDGAFAAAAVSGLSLDAASVTAWVRLGPAASAWAPLWSFDAAGGGLRCELSDTNPPLAPTLTRILTRTLTRLRAVLVRLRVGPQPQP